MAAGQSVVSLPARRERPSITVTPGDLPGVVTAAEMVLLAGGSEIYQRGGVLVRPIRLAEPGGDTWLQRAPGALTLLTVDPTWLQLELARLAEFVKFDARLGDVKPIDVPVEVARAYLALAGEWRAPPLRGVIEAPTVRADGSILAKPGYDAATGLLAEFDGRWPAPPAEPSQSEARAALKRLMRLVAEYPFATVADRAIWPAMVLTALIRATLPTAPLLAVSSPTPGSGKTELANAAAILATGRRAPAMTWGANDEESEKRLGALMLAGDPIVLLDNIERPLAGEQLCAALTSQEISVRVLGQSRNVRIPTSVSMFATGNNLVIRGDLNRRALVAVIDPGVERPELRRFDWTPNEYALEHRVHLVNDALTILRAHHLAGYPGYRELPPFGSFEDWSRRVRAALLFAGAADPVDVIERTREKDPERELLAALVRTWLAAIGPGPITVREVLHQTDSRQYPNPPLEELREVIDSVRMGHDAARSLGRYLSRHEGRIVDRARFVRRGTEDGAVRWALDRLS